MDVRPARAQGRQGNATCRAIGHADAWLQGFEGVPLGCEPKPATDKLESELDESAVAQGDS